MLTMIYIIYFIVLNRSTTCDSFTCCTLHWYSCSMRGLRLGLLSVFLCASTIIHICRFIFIVFILFSLLLVFIFQMKKLNSVFTNIIPLRQKGHQHQHRNTHNGLQNKRSPSWGEPGMKKILPTPGDVTREHPYRRGERHHGKENTNSQRSWAKWGNVVNNRQGHTDNCSFAYPDKRSSR